MSISSLMKMAGEKLEYDRQQHYVACRTESMAWIQDLPQGLVRSLCGEACGMVSWRRGGLGNG